MNVYEASDKTYPKIQNTKDKTWFPEQVKQVTVDKIRSSFLSHQYFEIN